MSLAYTKALSPQQERRISNYLEDAFLELTRGYKKRSEPTTNVPTLNSYLQAAEKIFMLILQIPPVDPSTSLRTAFLLKLTNDVLMSIPGYSPDQQSIQLALDWLDDLDGAWVSVLQRKAWDPNTRTDMDAAEGTKASLPTQTDRTRLKSLIMGGSSTLEEWISIMFNTEENDKQDDISNMLPVPLQDGLEQLFAGTLRELKAMGTFSGDPEGATSMSLEANGT